MTTTICIASKFLSTLSLRRATQRHSPDSTHRQISIHALLAESDFEKFEGVIATKISIHALLAESDFDDLKVPANVSKISIHALLAESD